MIESKIIQRVKDILNDNEKLKEKYINDRGGKAKPYFARCQKL